MTLYRANSAQEYVIAAQNRLVAHRLDAETGRCVRCGQFAPCEPANEAFSRLRRYGVAPPAGGAHDLLDRSRARAPRPGQAPLMTLAALRRAQVTR